MLVLISAHSHICRYSLVTVHRLMLCLTHQTHSRYTMWVLFEFLKKQTKKNIHGYWHKLNILGVCASCLFNEDGAFKNGIGEVHMVFTWGWGGILEMVAVTVPHFLFQ